MEDIEQYIQRHISNKEKATDFVDYLYDLMKKHNFETVPELYTRANITKQSTSQILSGKVTPSLNTCLKIAFAMKLNNHECKYLLKKAGYTLSSSSTFSLVIRYCIENKIYDLCDVNDYLARYNLEIIE